MFLGSPFDRHREQKATLNEFEIVCRIPRLYEMAAVVSLDVGDFRREIGVNTLPAKVWGG